MPNEPKPKTVKMWQPVTKNECGFYLRNVLYDTKEQALSDFGMGKPIGAVQVDVELKEG